MVNDGWDMVRNGIERKFLCLQGAELNVIGGSQSREWFLGVLPKGNGELSLETIIFVLNLFILAKEKYSRFCSSFRIFTSKWFPFLYIWHFSHYHGSKRDGHLIRLGSQVAGFFVCEDASVIFLAVYNGTSPLCLWVQFPNCRKIPGASVVLVLSFGSLVLVLSFGSL